MTPEKHSHTTTCVSNSIQQKLIGCDYSCINYTRWNMGRCIIQDIRPKLILKSNLVKSRLPINHLLVIHHYPIVSKFWTEHSSATAVLCAKFQNDWTTETDIKVEIKMSVVRISYIAQHPWSQKIPHDFGRLYLCCFVSNCVFNIWRF